MFCYKTEDIDKKNKKKKKKKKKQSSIYLKSSGKHEKFVKRVGIFFSARRLVMA